MFFIKTNPAYKDDEGLHLHEYEHIKQFWGMWFLFSALGYFISPLSLILAIPAHGVFYSLSKKYRLWSEVSAYKKQLSTHKKEHQKHYIDQYAKFLSEDYKLNITYSYAKEKLLS